MNFISTGYHYMSNPVALHSPRNIICLFGNCDVMVNKMESMSGPDQAYSK